MGEQPIWTHFTRWEINIFGHTVQDGRTTYLDKLYKMGEQPIWTHCTRWENNLYLDTLYKMGEQPIFGHTVQDGRTTYIWTHCTR